MKTGIKELRIVVLLAAVFILLTGCQSKEEQKTAAEPAETEISAEGAESVEDTDAGGGAKK